MANKRSETARGLRKDPWEPTRRFFEELEKLRAADPNTKIYMLKPGMRRGR